MKVEIDLSNYVTRKLTGVDTFDFAKKTNLASLKFDVDKLGIDNLKNVLSDLISLKSKVDKLSVYKLEPAPVDLSKLSDVLKNDIVKKMNMMNRLKKLMLFRLLIPVI